MKIKEYVEKSKYSEMLHLTRYELAFCLAYFVLALIICVYSTPKGSLFSPDSIGYVRDAENFLSNFPIYYTGPIYPALIAIGMIFGLTSIQSAGLVPIICYSLLGFPVYLIGKIISRPMTGYISCIVCLLCGKWLLYISTLAWTDMPYLFFTALAILFISMYNKYRILSSITVAALFAIISFFTRSLGIALIPVGIIVIILSNKGLKNSWVPILYYCLMPISFFILWLIKANKTYHLSPAVLTNPSGLNLLKLPLDLNVIQFVTFIKNIFYTDYKLTVLLISLLIALIVIYISLNNKIYSFIKDTIPISSYILIYSIMLIIATSSFSISINNVAFDFRYVIPIYPYVLLLIVSLFVYAYDTIDDRFYKGIFKTFSIILLICLVAQGANSLYSQANGIRMQSINEYSDKLELNKYLSEYNITDNDVIYFDVSNGYNSHLSLVFYERTPNIKKRYVKSTNPKTTILDNLTLPFAGAGPDSAKSLADLIRENKNLPIYLIAPNKVLQNYMEHPPKEICLINPEKFLKSFICMVNLKNNGTCNINPFPKDYIIDNSSSITTALAGNFMGQKHDQLLILKSNPNITKENIRQIIDFAKGSAAKIEYYDRSETAWINANHSILSGDFMDLGYDQAFHIERHPTGDRIVIEDFSQGKAPAIVRYSEVLANNSVLKNLQDSEDAQFAGDFLGRGHSQVLFIDRNPRGRKLVIADFIEGRTPEMTKFSEIDGNSTLLSSLLDDKDKQFSGDFMGLGYSQLLMINCNHTNAKEPKIIIADFSKGKKSASLRYLENWGESSTFLGWLDVNDTQLVGDFMGLGHNSQVLFVNHDHGGGKIMIADFGQGKPPANIKYWESWDKGIIFQGWLNIKDMRVAGDFKDLGYSQVLFLNNSINGSNATIVEFINGKSEIAL